ncbi:MAG: 50S ribosomal protein L28 [Candidatus Neomarinimicrobiota bacterium]|nr:50S ribosomal protein L28 [Candidatus Neomarinimicrobiota bacterium]MEC9455254.1 50S ribosomal protein L28 [Candidatus Neomarinimicrobiota bacterium]MED5450975.1 50S ribosomal protein L28 [Candidatus Neomarinimicrobiota bacterium]MEE3241481.1 50S ribosomal protein L28 [Candidatus Neomarinimicrobiota bacterium]
MSRVCEVTGKKVMYGNNVSHAHNKTRRKFDINLQKKTFWVDSLNKSITLRVSAKGLRIIDKKGIDVVIRDLVSQGRKF